MLFCQQPSLSRSFAAQRWFDGGNAASFKSINHASNCRVRQTTEFHNLHCPITFSAQPHNPLTPLMQLPQGRISCVVLFHPLNMGTIPDSSNIIVPCQWRPVAHLHDLIPLPATAFSSHVRVRHQRQKPITCIGRNARIIRVSLCAPTYREYPASSGRCLH